MYASNAIKFISYAGVHIAGGARP